MDWWLPGSPIVVVIFRLQTAPARSVTRHETAMQKGMH